VPADEAERESCRDKISLNASRGARNQTVGQDRFLTISADRLDPR
jgi:hypothetical protein